MEPREALDSALVAFLGEHTGFSTPEIERFFKVLMEFCEAHDAELRELYDE